IISAWQRYFMVLQAKLAISIAPGWISHMANIWSNDNQCPFLAMTAHWISEEPSTSTLKLKLALLVFH
ncbi:hypothetical protein PAXRUDRAFT_112492, partial [Paxillus rubicundulus Ve08.2h10]